MHLAVRVALGHVVEVDQRQPPDRAARERFDRPRSHPADPDHRDMRPLERRQRRGTI